MSFTKPPGPRGPQNTHTEKTQKKKIQIHYKYVNCEARTDSIIVTPHFTKKVALTVKWIPNLNTNAIKRQESLYPWYLARTWYERKRGQNG